MIECALLGFKASISNELSLLSQLLQEPPQEKSHVLRMSPIQPFGVTMENTKEEFEDSPLEAEEKLEVPQLLRQTAEEAQRQGANRAKAKVETKAQSRVPVAGSKKEPRKVAISEYRNAGKRTALRECPSVVTKKKL
eukprot:TRINITY_DN7944_c0_g3_i1.p1 TRINITY_DN7944_c0_g3~~TRINITY_DN7944_c0_g3_i1.p1  ORF type:complete len:137 (+),score=39.73 TRINITY_DN7944_c0_g3_i1:131-541(+)